MRKVGTLKKVSDPPDDLYALSMRKRSGTITTSDRFVAFLYTLMRDAVVPGQVEYVMLQVDKETARSDFDGKYVFTNGWLAGYAKDVMVRLSKKAKKMKKKKASVKKR